MAKEETSVTGFGGSSWWNSWMIAAKSRSAEVLEFVKRDLDEISSAVKNEATTVVSNTATAFKETLQLDKPESAVSNVKRSFSSFLGQVSNALSPPPDDGDEEAILIQGDNPVLLTRLQTRLYNLYNDTNTFTNEIEDQHESIFEAWLANLDEHHLSNERLTRLLVSNPILQQNYETLVPQQVTHAQFWKRLLFRKAMIEDDEAVQERREERDRLAVESFQWDKEEKLGNHLELSEEEQIRLLQEYENEKNEETSTKQNQQISQEPDTNSRKEDRNLKLSVREKKDLVIVSSDQNCSSTSTSTGDKESNDDDWEREFDLDDETEVNDYGTLNIVH